MPNSIFHPYVGGAQAQEIGRNPVEQLRHQEQMHEATQRYRRDRQTLIDRWRVLGGPASPLGLPLDPAFPLNSLPNGAKVVFRGGALKVRNNDPGVVEVVTESVIVSFEGFGLDIRQERGDELYGTLDCKIGSTGYRQSFDLPQVELGPEESNRVFQSSIVLWDGPPADINIIASLAEHDEGDREQVRQMVRGRVRQIFEKGQQAMGALVPGSETTAVKSALASESISNNSLQDWLIDGIGDLVNDVLGLGDDLYNPVGLTITAAEMRQFPPLQTYHCWSDTRTIPFTHSRTVTCRDDGGDPGQVTMLFLVRKK